MLKIYQTEKFEYLYPEPYDLEEILSYKFIVDKNENIQCKTIKDFRMYTKYMTYKFDQLFKQFEIMRAEVFDYDYSRAILDDAMIEAGAYTPEAQKEAEERKEKTSLKVFEFSPN